MRGIGSRIICVAAGLALAVACVAPAAWARTWVAADGRFSVEAELIEQIGSTVRLRRESDGRVIDVPLAKLSAADQQFLRQVAAGGAPAATTPAGAAAAEGMPAVGAGGGASAATPSANTTPPSTSAATAGGVPAVFAGVAVVDGAPVLNLLPRVVPGLPSPREHRPQQNKLFWLMRVAADPQRIPRFVEAMESDGWEKAYRDGGNTADLMNNLHQAFFAKNPGDRLLDLQYDSNEFERLRRAKQFLQAQYPELLKLAPKMPVRVAILGSAKLGAYDRQLEAFQLPRILGDVLPKHFFARSASTEAIEIGYDSPGQLPTSLPMSPEQGEVLLADSPDRQVYVVAFLRVTKLWSEDGFHDDAAVVVEKIAAFAGNSLAKPLHVYEFAGSASATAATGGDAPASAGASEPQAGKLGRLAAQFGLPTCEGLPVMAHHAGDRSDPSHDAWCKLFDFVELTRTPDYLGLSAVTPEPVTIEGHSYVPSAAIDRLTSVGSRFVLWQLPPSEGARFINTWTRQGQRALDTSDPWKGATQFDRLDLQTAFAKEYAAKVAAGAVDLPLQVVVAYRVDLSGYDMKTQSFPFAQHQIDLASEFPLPSPISAEPSPRWSDSAWPPPCVPPAAWKVPPGTARKLMSQLADRDRQGFSLYMACAAEIDGLEIARGGAGERLPLLARLQWRRLYADPGLTKQLHEFALWQAPPAVLVAKKFDAKAMPREVNSWDDMAMSAAIVHGGGGSLGAKTWSSMYGVQAQRDQEHYGQLRGLSDMNQEWASAAAFAASQGRAANPDRKPLDSAELKPFEAATFFPPGFQAPQYEDKKLSAAEQKLLLGWLQARGQAIETVLMHGQFGTSGSNLAVMFGQSDSSSTDPALKQLGVGMLVPLNQIYNDNWVSESFAPRLVGKEGESLQPQLALSMSSAELLAALPAAVREDIQRNSNPYHHVKLHVKIKDVALLKQRSMLLIRAEPVEIAILAIDDAPELEDRSWRERLKTVHQQTFAGE